MTLLRLLNSTVDTNSGRARFVLRASLLAIAPSLLVFGMLVAMGIDTLRAPTGTLDPAFIAYSVLLAPVIETAGMLALAAVLARLVPKHVALRIVLIAFVVALAHRIGGDWRQVVNTIWPILVYATSVVLWLRRSASDALITTTIVHALYNIAFFAVGILGPLAMSDGGERAPMQTLIEIGRPLRGDFCAVPMTGPGRLLPIELSAKSGRRSTTLLLRATASGLDRELAQPANIGHTASRR